MKRAIALAALGLALAGCCARNCGTGCCAAPDATAVSPDGRNEIRLWSWPLAYEVRRDGKLVVAKSAIGMVVNGKSLRQGAAIKAVVRKSVKGAIATPVYKKETVDVSREETFADFGSWGVRLAARNDGVAYRFETSLPGKVKVNEERAQVWVPCGEMKCSLNYGSRYGCEETVPLSCKAKDIETGKDASRKYVYLPFVYSTCGTTVAVTESDVRDYPILNLKRESSPLKGVALDAEFSQWPKSVVNDSGEPYSPTAARKRFWKIKEPAGYLVETDGTRTFPWRTFILADSPAKLCEADIVYALAEIMRDGYRDFEWVKPGKVAWDWWNAWDCKGEKDGCTTAGYERFIDFAAKTGVEYVIFDEGWSEKLNIWKFSPAVDVPHLIKYAAKKGVGIILWMSWAQVYGDEARVASHFAKLGAKGFKVDFMDRGDADVERFLWKFADECAKNRMVVDYHGAHRPTGMSRAYPNVLNYEGVHGLECTKWYKGDYDFMDNDVKAFFLRMTAGPMDYTPGAMDNYPVGGYPKPDLKSPYRTGNTYVNPGSVGTRCRQMAMMALYEAPLQMLCDAPTKYEKNMECFKFMAATPVVWADTIGLGGCPDSFAAVARKSKSGAWYAAAITNADGRDYELDTSFLGDGVWKAEIFRDAAESDVKPTAYVHEARDIKAGYKINLRMAKGGGFVVKFSR